MSIEYSSDEEGAIECVREQERKKEGKRERGGGGVGVLDMDNRPRHECSSTHISTHPLQFKLSNGTPNSLLHPLTLHKERKLTLTPTHTHACAGGLNRHTNAEMQPIDNM